jgi:hypothetical protein
LVPHNPDIIRQAEMFEEVFRVRQDLAGEVEQTDEGLPVLDVLESETVVERVF